MRVEKLVKAAKESIADNHDELTGSSIQLMLPPEHQSSQ